MKKLIGFLAWLIPATALAATTFYWTPPTTNEDGSPLTDLGGYKIYCGPAPGTYNAPVDVGNPAIPEYPVSGVVTAEGQHFCTLTAYDAAGNESQYSNEVSFPLVVAPGAPGGFGVRGDK